MVYRERRVGNKQEQEQEQLEECGENVMGERSRALERMMGG